MMKRRRFLAISAAACISSGAAPARAFTWSGHALGAEATITLRGTDADTSLVLERIQDELRKIDALFSLYLPHSALSRLNAAGTLRDPDPDFLALLRLCGRLHRATGGAFDPTVQPLWRAHATGGDIEAARARVGWAHVQLSEAQISIEPGQALTLNGIAQGWASDRIAALLRQAGYGEVMVNIGEFACVGGPWRIGIANESGQILSPVTLTDRAIATSCPNAMHIGEVPHILAKDARHTPLWHTVSVEADRAAIADGLSTACCYLNRDQSFAACQAVPGGAVVRQYLA